MPLRFSRQVNMSEPIQLSGPFLPEALALQEYDKYNDVLEKTWFHSNLVISRDLLITSPDPEFIDRDDIRIQAGITHHSHQFKLFVDDITRPEPLTLDHFILLNTDDVELLRDYFQHHPLLPREIKIITHKN